MTEHVEVIYLNVIWGYSAYREDWTCVNEEGPASFSYQTVDVSIIQCLWAQLICEVKLFTESWSCSRQHTTALHFHCEVKKGRGQTALCTVTADLSNLLRDEAVT